MSIVLFFLALSVWGAVAVWLSGRKDRTGFLGFLEMVRSALAYEGERDRPPDRQPVRYFVITLEIDPPKDLCRQWEREEAMRDEGES